MKLTEYREQAAERKPRGGPTRIFAATEGIKLNREDGGNRPTIIILYADGTNEAAHFVRIPGESSVVQSPEPPMPGWTANIWVEVDAPIFVTVEEWE